MKNKNYVCGRFAYRSDVGKVRISNEDQAFAAINQSGNILLLVCDGMGGQNKGDLASNIAKKCIVDEFRKKNKFFTKPGAIHWVNKVICYANKEIYRLANENPLYKEMGTTITLALIINNFLIYAQMGDSRLYILDKKNNFKQISEDQTYVGYLYRSHQITKEEMKVHPKRHLLMNALGIFPSASIDIEFRKYSNESLLLCSDGLYNNASDEDIASIVKGEDTTEEKINQLISLANSNGGSDNISVVLWEANK